MRELSLNPSKQSKQYRMDSRRLSLYRKRQTIQKKKKYAKLPLLKTFSYFGGFSSHKHYLHCPAGFRQHRCMRPRSSDPGC
jgi:hypothetical protein